MVWLVNGGQKSSRPDLHLTGVNRAFCLSFEGGWGWFVLAELSLHERAVQPLLTSPNLVQVAGADAECHQYQDGH